MESVSGGGGGGGGVVWWRGARVGGTCLALDATGLPYNLALLITDA